MIDRICKIPQKKSFFLFGPRQTGKTTLLANACEKGHHYNYNLLESEQYQRLLAHPQLLREDVVSRPKEINCIIIDEIQRVPELLNEIQTLLDKNPDLQFIMTGSSARKLKRKDANLLGGRALTCQLYPLIVNEWQAFATLTNVLCYGALPAIILEKDLETRQGMLRSYVDTYLKEEIEHEVQARRLGQFVRFLTLAAHENGNPLNFSNIAQAVGVAANTVKSYFQILEDTLIGFFFYPWHKSQRERLSKHPKFYFFDTGVTRALTKKLSVPLEPMTSEFGGAFEHFLILETMRLNHYFQLDHSLSYYRTEGGAEVDMIIETPHNEVIAVEIKSGADITGKNLRGLKSFKKDVDKAKLYCVARVPVRQIREDITILPWQEFLELYQQRRL